MGRLDKLYKTDVPHRAKLVYIYLHDRMDKERKAWPGLNTIAWSYVKKKYKLNMPFLRLAYPARASAFSSNAA